MTLECDMTATEILKKTLERNLQFLSPQIREEISVKIGVFFECWGFHH